jgi:cobalt-zinc-cadmium efflux system outer membrane protein
MEDAFHMIRVFWRISMYMPFALLTTNLICLLVGDLASAQQLKLSAAKKIALENNPRVAAASAKWDAAKARRLVAMSLQDPELKLEYEELPGILDFGKYGERTIGVTQKIQFPVKWWYQQRASSQEAEAVRYSALGATRLDVEISTEITFDRVLTDQKILEAAEENLQLARDFADKARVRFDAGDVAKLEVMSAMVQVGLAENGFADAEAQLATSKLSLRSILGQDGLGPIEIAGKLELEPATHDLEFLKRKAMAERPDLNGARLRQQSVRSSRSGAAVSLVPDLSIGVSRQTIGAANSRSSFWRTTLGLEIPIWGFLRQRGQIAAAAADVRQSEATYRSLERNAMLEVEMSYSTLKTTLKRAKVFETGVVNFAKAAHDASSRSYRQGKATYLEVLGAQKSLIETRIAYYESIYQYRRARAELARATGGSL